MPNQELPMSKQNLANVSIQDLLRLDQVYRTANTLEKFLRDCNVHQQTWNRAIQILRSWTEIQEAIIRYVLYRNNSARERAITSLRALLSNLGRLVRFTLPSEKFTTTDFISETQLSFEKEAYRYLGFDKPIFCLTPFSTQPSPNDFEAIVRRIHKTGRKLNIVLVLTLGNADSIRPIHRDYSDYSIILHDEHDVKNLIFADNAKFAFKQLVVRDINPERIQPYSSTGINLSMFYNRDVEKGRILDTPKSYAIFGPRRIGKSSLLRAIERRLAEEPDYNVFYFSCQERTPSDIRSILLEAIGVTQRGRDSDNFESLVKAYIQRSGKKFVFLLDEVDALIDKAAQEEQRRFFISLRNLHNELQEQCRFLFAGFQTLESQLDNYYSPFYNFAERLPIGFFDKDAAKYLISEPIENDLFLKFSNDALIADIIDKTLGHPALIQFFCRKLVERACKEHQTIITADDIDAVFGDYEYRNQISRCFWRNLSKLQQLIVMQMLSIPKEENTSLEIMEELANNDIHLNTDELESNLHSMIVTGVIEKKNKFYSFAHKLFPLLLSQSEDTINLLFQLKKEFLNEKINTTL